MLSIHGQREDGYHSLSSLMVALKFGDRLRISISKRGCDRIHCTDSQVPTDEYNLVIKAAKVFRLRTGINHFFDFQIEKHIPMGAGLGGGSSNAATALCAMNELSGEPLNRTNLLETAMALGSDCPFFINKIPSKVSGRGEILSPLPIDLVNRFSGLKLILFCPPFEISTSWAYRHLKEFNPSIYEPQKRAQARMDLFFASGLMTDLLYNTFEISVGRKYLAISCLLEQLRAKEIHCLMSGSGSCCFALWQSQTKAELIREICKCAWGKDVFFVETSIL